MHPLFSLVTRLMRLWNENQSFWHLLTSLLSVFIIFQSWSMYKEKESTVNVIHKTTKKHRTCYTRLTNENFEKKKTMNSDDNIRKLWKEDLWSNEFQSNVHCVKIKLSSFIVFRLYLMSWRTPTTYFKKKWCWLILLYSRSWCWQLCRKVIFIRRRFFSSRYAGCWSIQSTIGRCCHRFT